MRISQSRAVLQRWCLALHCPVSSGLPCVGLTPGLRPSVVGDGGEALRSEVESPDTWFCTCSQVPGGFALGIFLLSSLCLGQGL